MHEIATNVTSFSVGDVIVFLGILILFELLDTSL